MRRPLVAILLATALSQPIKTEAWRGWQPWQWDTFVAQSPPITWCESNDMPTKQNGRYWGLYQVDVNLHAARIAELGYTRADMLEAYPNTVVAFTLWLDSGWHPWAYCSRQAGLL